MPQVGSGGLLAYGGQYSLTGKKQKSPYAGITQASYLPQLLALREAEEQKKQNIVNTVADLNNYQKLIEEKQTAIDDLNSRVLSQQTSQFQSVIDEGQALAEERTMAPVASIPMDLTKGGVEPPGTGAVARREAALQERSEYLGRATTPNQEESRQAQLGQLTAAESSAFKAVPGLASVMPVAGPIQLALAQKQREPIQSLIALDKATLTRAGETGITGTAAGGFTAAYGTYSFGEEGRGTTPRGITGIGASGGLGARGRGVSVGGGRGFGVGPGV